MAVRQGLRGGVVWWRPLLFFIILVPTIVNLGGCLKAFTQATNQPPTAHYEAGGELSNDALPSPQLLDFRLNVSDD